MAKQTNNILIGISFSSRIEAHLWGMVNYFARVEARKRGVELQIQMASNDLLVQIQHIQELVEQGIDALLINAQSSEAPELIAAIQNVLALGIPVIAMDSDIGDGICTTTVSADNVKCQQTVATYLFEKLEGRGKVAHIQGTAHLESSILRTQGVHQALAEYPNIDLVFEKHSDYRGSLTAEIMAECLAIHRDLDAIIAANDINAEKIIEALAAAGIEKPILISGFDAQIESLVPINHGKMAVTVKYDPQQLAEMSMDMAIRALSGEQVPKQQFMDVVLVTPENVEYEIASYLAILPNFVTDVSIINHQLQREIEDRKEAQKALKLQADELTRSNEKRKQTQQVLKAYANELERSNQDLQNFAFVASHDLHEPLRKIQIFGNRLQEKYSHALDKRGLDYLSRMQSSSARMQTFIDDLLAYSRLTTDAQTLQTTDLNQILQTVLDDLKFQIQENHAEVVANRLPIIEANPTQMRQLFQNLLSNAIKFRRPNLRPIIHITSQLTPANSMEIRIIDNGIGFDPEYSERIFGMFQRLHGRSAYVGTGIGLAICRKIVEQHHGKITAVSQPNQGTTFIITLPITQEAN